MDISKIGFISANVVGVLMFPFRLLNAPARLVVVECTLIWEFLGISFIIQPELYLFFVFANCIIQMFCRYFIQKQSAYSRITVLLRFIFTNLEYILLTCVINIFCIILTFVKGLDTLNTYYYNFFSF